MSLKVISVGGARPNFVKLAPLLRTLGCDQAFESVLVHTGQHYDEQMSGRFFTELGMPAPRHHLNVGSASHAQQTAAIMQGFERVVLEERPAAVIVVGDVNSTLGAALVASKLGIPVVHVEAGLRSFDRGMPEEINRLVTDAIADLLLVSEASGLENLRREGVSDSRMELVGNLMVDSLLENLQQAKARKPLAGMPDGPFGLVTLHRPANVDDPERFGVILSALTAISTRLPLVFPVHPRTRSRMNSDLASSNIRLTEALGYLDFLNLMARASLVLTDSGGIQEETTALGIPCLTLRENTERPITITEGTNRLAGTTGESILAAWEQHLESPKIGRQPQFWDGKAASRCHAALRRFLNSRRAVSGAI